jgi:uncharacterized protein
MNLPTYRLSAHAFAALASGGGGQEAVAVLAAAEYCKHVILVNGVLSAAEGSPHYADALEGYDLLAAAWRASPAAVEPVIAYPAVGAWALRTILAMRTGGAAEAAGPGDLRAVAAAAAIRAGLDVEIEVPVRDGHVALPSLGTAILSGDPRRAVAVRTGPDRAMVGSISVRDGEPGWRALPRVGTGPLNVVIDDLHPFRMPGATDLSPPIADPAVWERVLRDAWRILEIDHPDTAAEVAAAVSVIVPRSPTSHLAVSSSSPEVFGTIAMSLPPDPVSGAEFLVHEVQHLKLGALLDVVRLTLPDDGRRYYAPWRDDPRPLNGLLQGTYAFLGVTGFWRQRRLMGRADATDLVFAHRLYTVTMAVDTLGSSGRLSHAGLEFVGHMERTLATWRGDRVPAAERARARQLAQEHQARWESAHGTLPR